MDKIKKAFLMVYLGSAYQEACQLTIDSMNSKMCSDVFNCEVRQAFTSRTLIEALAENNGIQVDDEKQALERLQKEGFSEVIVQPFRIVASEDYEKVKTVVQGCIDQNGFDKIEALPCLTVGVKEISHMVN